MNEPWGNRSEPTDGKLRIQLCDSGGSVVRGVPVPSADEIRTFFLSAGLSGTFGLSIVESKSESDLGPYLGGNSVKVSPMSSASLRLAVRKGNSKAFSILKIFAPGDIAEQEIRDRLRSVATGSPLVSSAPSARKGRIESSQPSVGALVNDSVAELDPFDGYSDQDILCMVVSLIEMAEWAAAQRELLRCLEGAKSSCETTIRAAEFSLRGGEPDFRSANALAAKQSALALLDAEIVGIRASLNPEEIRFSEAVWETASKLRQLLSDA